MIEVACPKCDRPFKVQEASAGVQHKCLICGATFELEIVEEEEVVEDEYEVVEESAAAASKPAAEPASKKKKKKKNADEIGVAKPRRRKKKQIKEPVPRWFFRVAGLAVLALILGGFSYFLRNAFDTFEKKVIGEEEAVAAVKAAGGKLEFGVHEKKRVVTGVSFRGLSGSFKYAYLEPLEGFPHLVKLDLNSTKTGDLASDYIKVFPNLKKLDLGNTKVSDAFLKEIAGLTQLEELLLENTLVTDIGLNALSGCKKLKYVSLSGTLADGDELATRIPGLKVSKY